MNEYTEITKGATRNTRSGPDAFGTAHAANGVETLCGAVLKGKRLMSAPAVTCPACRRKIAQAAK